MYNTHGHLRVLPSGRSAEIPRKGSMNLHRVLATAAATAVISSTALFTAPAVYASSQAPADGSLSASATPTTAAEPSPTYTRPTFCSGIPDEERAKTSLRGLPSEIVAGSGWHDFSYRVTNVSEIKVMETDISLYLGSADPDISDIAELAVTVQWFNEATGAWKPIEGEGAGALDNDEFATVKTLEPGEFADAAMRIKVGEKAKPGTGYFFTLGHSYGEDDQCGFDEISQFDFKVLAPGSNPGQVEDSEGKPGEAEGVNGKPSGGNTPAPRGAVGEKPVSATLADTGASSATQTTALLGAAAVVIGAGAVFFTRRHKAGSTM